MGIMNRKNNEQRNERKTVLYYSKFKAQTHRFIPSKFTLISFVILFIFLMIIAFQYYEIFEYYYRILFYKRFYLDYSKQKAQNYPQILIGAVEKEYAEIDYEINILKLVQTDLFDINEETLYKCVSDWKNFHKMYADYKCYSIWLKLISTREVVNIDKVEGVSLLSRAEEKDIPKEERLNKAMSNGGVRMHFDPLIFLPKKQTNYLLPNLYMGYWKPCTRATGKGESFTSEVVSFWIDRIIGFRHTPPVVPRYFSSSSLCSLSSHYSGEEKEEVKEKIESIVNYCGKSNSIFAPITKGLSKILPINQSNDGAEGAMVGWSPYNVSVVFGPRYFVNLRKINESELEWAIESRFNLSPEQTSKEQIQKTSNALEIISAHLFSFLVGNLNKFDHNLFIAKYGQITGPFVYIDNDRSQWNFPIYQKIKTDPIEAMRSICIFPKRISERILLLRSANHLNNKGRTLSKILMQMNDEIYRGFSETFFKLKDSLALESNVNYIADIIDQCVYERGIDKVLIEEPWPSPLFF